jgi:5-formyltetrahydrofolate cyclo-ligase
MTDATTLRRQLKRARNGIPDAVAKQHSRAILRQVQRILRRKNPRRIAGYVGHKGEVDPMPLLRAWQDRSRIYLPVLHPFRAGKLWFCRWHTGVRMSPNRFDIDEPACGAAGMQTAQTMDVVITPLLGFDPACHRLGMGGGFYDRTFAFRHRRQHIGRPLLIGLAFEVQRLDELATQPWDIDLDLIVTERCVYKRAATANPKSD